MTTITADAAPLSVDTEASGPAPRILDHEYDGIREYDNPLPGWWRMIFYLCIAFAAVYFVVYQMGWGEGPAAKYKAAALAYKIQHQNDQQSIASASEDTLIAGAKDSTIVGKGHDIFVAKCASCHTPDGHGLIGPNLTDSFQLHGSTREDLFNTIRDGAPGTAMPAWSGQLAAADMVEVASFVASIRGTNVPGGKAPQGKLIQP